MSGFIKVLGLVVTIIFSVGAMIGAMITMYAAVANRTREMVQCAPSGSVAGASWEHSWWNAILLSLIARAIGEFFLRVLHVLRPGYHDQFRELPRSWHSVLPRPDIVGWTLSLL